jgi:hypothetical protein
MRVSAFRLSPGSTEATEVPRTLTGYVVAKPLKQRVRPGAAARRELAATPEGEAAVRAARRVLGEMLAQDDLSALAAVRLKAGLSQDDVYRRTGIMQPQLSRLENGRTPQPSAGTVEMLAAAYDVSMEEIMNALRLSVQRAEVE